MQAGLETQEEKKAKAAAERDAKKAAQAAEKEAEKARQKAEKAAEKERKKKEKEEQAAAKGPKRPTTAYFCYTNEVRDVSRHIMPGPWRRPAELIARWRPSLSGGEGEAAGRADRPGAKGGHWGSCEGYWSGMEGPERRGESAVQ